MVGGESGEKHTDQFFDQQTNQSNRLTPEQLAFAHILANPADVASLQNLMERQHILLENLPDF